VRLFLGLEKRFLLTGLGVALRVLAEAARLLVGAADSVGGNPLAADDPPGPPA